MCRGISEDDSGMTFNLPGSAALCSGANFIIGIAEMSHVERACVYLRAGHVNWACLFYVSINMDRCNNFKALNPENTAVAF